MLLLFCFLPAVVGFVTQILSKDNPVDAYQQGSAIKPKNDSSACLDAAFWTRGGYVGCWGMLGVRDKCNTRAHQWFRRLGNAAVQFNNRGDPPYSGRTACWNAWDSVKKPTNPLHFVCGTTCGNGGKEQQTFITPDPKNRCDPDFNSPYFRIHFLSFPKDAKTQQPQRCLTSKGVKKWVQLEPCDQNNDAQLWFVPAPGFEAKLCK